jgi:hypothetical protein
MPDEDFTPEEETRINEIARVFYNAWVPVHNHHRPHETARVMFAAKFKAYLRHLGDDLRGHRLTEHDRDTLVEALMHDISRMQDEDQEESA